MTNDDALLTAVTNIESSIADEISNREAADSAIIDSVSVLEQTLTNQIGAVSDSLNQEVIDREAAIDLVGQVIQDLTDSTDTFMFGINEQVTQISTDLSAEVVRATSSELSLESKLSSDISTELTRATSSELSLDTRLSSEGGAISTRLNQVPVVAAFTIGDGVSTSFTLEHALGTTDVIVQVFEIATGSTVETESIRVDLQSMSIQFSSVPSVDKYRVVAMGIKSFSLPA